MKKIIKISLILLAILCIMTNVYAYSCNMALQTAKDEFKKNEEVVVNAKITSIDAKDGIIGLKATLEYDKNSLSFVGMTGENGWSNPSYNEANGVFVMDRNNLVNTSETILKITFKVKEQSAQNATITLKDITVSGGEDTKDIHVANMTKTITIKNGSSTTNPDVNTNTNTNTNNNTANNSNTNTNTNQNTNNNGSGVSNQNTNGNGNMNGNQSIVANTTNNNQNNSMKTGILPKTGATNIILVALGVVVLVAVISYIKMKIIDKKMGSK